jgi:hypothetical protein
MALGINRKRINAKGTNSCRVRQISPTPVDAYTNLGLVQNVKTNFKTEDQDAVDGSGLLQNSVQTGEVCKLTLELMQSAAEEINGAVALRGTYQDLYFVCQLEESGQYQHCRIPVAKVISAIELEYMSPTKRKIALTVACLAPKAAFSGTPSDASVVINRPYTIWDDTTADNHPTDTASALATAVL